MIDQYGLAQDQEMKEVKVVAKIEAYVVCCFQFVIEKVSFPVL